MTVKRYFINMVKIKKGRTGKTRFFTLKLGISLWNKLNTYTTEANKVSVGKIYTKKQILTEAVCWKAETVMKSSQLFIGIRTFSKVNVADFLANCFPGFHHVDISEFPQVVKRETDGDNYTMAIDFEESIARLIYYCAVEENLSFRLWVNKALSEYLDVVLKRG